MSAQAGPLADAEARKQVVVQETEVADLEAEREEKRLDTQVRRPADAEAYRQRVEAEGQRAARGEAEGSAVRAKGLAEAEAIGKRAEALEAQSDAVIGQQLAERLPEIVAAAAGAFRGVDQLT